MKKFLTLSIIVGLVMLWPFSCTPQSGGTGPTPDSCDTVFVDSPEWDAERETFNQMILRLTEQNIALRENVSNLDIQVTTLRNKVSSLESVVAVKDAEIVSLNSSVSNLEQLLAECKATPPEVVRDTVYQDKIVEVMPSPTIDTVFVTHSNDDKTNRKFFHHGPFDAPYPKDITFETKEFCMITVEFPDSLGTYRALDSFKVKRIMDHENAKTLYEFIK